MKASRFAGLPGLIGLAACLSAYAFLKHAFGILICDDAYITLAHARSWNAGLGPVMSAWNPVCATSTPLHTAILALEGAVLRTSDYLSLAYFTNLAWDLVGLFFLYRIARRGLDLAEPYALLALAAYALSVNFLAVSAYGMETPMYTALALAGSWFAFYAAPSRSGSSPPAGSAGAAGLRGLAAVAFLAPLARPEGALLPAVLILLRWRKEGGRPSRGLARPSGGLTRPSGGLILCAAASALGLAGFFAFNLYAYGRWLPHSILAKRLEIHVGFAEGLRSWILNVFYKGPCLGGTTVVTLANLAAMAAAAAGFLRPRRPGDPGAGTGVTGRAVPWELLAWPFLYFLFFTVTRSSYILFTWYYLPVLPFLILFLAAGIGRLARDRLPSKAAWAVLLAFLAYVPAQSFRQRLPQKHVFAEAAREGRYRQAARIVDSLAAPGKVPLVMIDEVGAIGYWSHARILDTHGLLSPEALPYLGPAEGYFLRMAALQDRFDPDWIMGLRLARDEGLLYPGEDGLYAGYEPAGILRLPPHGYNMELWRRQPPD
ncbi:MAG: putative rane protein [Fibrobacteres bacterium]|nr:putative rane protein [Fibrobacterota bacterium]